MATALFYSLNKKKKKKKKKKRKRKEKKKEEEEEKTNKQKNSTVRGVNIHNTEYNLTKNRVKLTCYMPKNGLTFAKHFYPGGCSFVSEGISGERETIMVV